MAHQGNNHKPHLIRWPSLLGIFFIALLLEGAVMLQTSPIISKIGFLGEVVSSILVQQTNESRAAEYLSTLKVNPALEAAAAAKARDMVEKGYFAHTSPEGVEPWYWFQLLGYKYAYAGENLAVNFSESRDVTDAWLKSPLHKANILNRNFTEIGIATAEGFFNGKPAVFVVQLFGTPAVAPAASRPTVAVNVPEVKETFVAVAGTEAAAPANVANETAAAGSTEAIPDFMERPKASANTIAIIISFLLGVVLIMKISKVGMLHPRAVTGAFAVLVLLATFVFLNQYVFEVPTTIL